MKWRISVSFGLQTFTGEGATLLEAERNLREKLDQHQSKLAASTYDTRAAQSQL